LSVKAVSGGAIPDDLVLVGHVSGAYGLRGWVRIQPYSSAPEALLHAKTWWLCDPRGGAEWRDVERMQARMQGGDVVAALQGVADRDAAEALKGSAVRISRRYFPALADGEFYWVDLIGLEVENLQGEALGSVRDLMDNGAHPILRVAAAEAPDSGEAPREWLIPFVEAYVKTVDQQARKITVDWGLDY
jgi:16S rRNA processing protein RimM